MVGDMLAFARPLELDEMHRALEEYKQLVAHYGTLLPKPESSRNTVNKPPEELAENALRVLSGWSHRTDVLLQERADLETGLQHLQLLSEYLRASQGGSAEVIRIAHRTEFLFKGLYACPKGHRLQANACASIDEYLPGERYNFFVVADVPANQTMVEKGCSDNACIQIPIPEWLSSEPQRQVEQVASRLTDIERRLDELSKSLVEAGQEAGLISAIQEMDLLDWFIANSDALSEHRKLCHVTGWTTAAEPEQLQRILHKCAIYSQVRFAEAPKHLNPPVSMLLPEWAHSFLPFVEMLGTPGRGEVNPTLLLPVIVSLLFGYMFPDVGHGLVLILVSLLLLRRWPKGRFLIPCGVSAVLFGFVFGEFFGLEGILEAWWVEPLEHPLLILVPPLFFGIGLMLLGLVFNGIEAYWRGDLLDWILRDAAVLTLYTAVFIGILEIEFLWLAGFSMIWFIGGQLYQWLRGRSRNLLLNLALLLQSLFELILNTISFLRVGAFALAHAALSMTVLQMIDGIENPVLHLVWLVIGHLLIVSMEGLVVFVQTTRLVLFEFCTRFLRAEGRIFRPTPSLNWE